ncbi:histone-lysine N-methyltransferase ash1 isoform X2 [Cimex lectularius]|uniref:Histone-lysine N-methyltransferase n=1 Tax=Cimex lectularius TaxID=79782 RepID=A0A8I6SAH6_CIMLE|nr:histone-lysine N-methyltransferase ash1 isoform X2 [Cimex lectularius]
MEYYIMPQVDKSASTYSPPVQYVSAIGPAASALVRSDINKFGVSSDILTSCDWSAVIHRPAEDSEPEDLPSTVDMDAIKEPATPLPPLTPCPPAQEEESDSEEESSGSESDGESSSNSNSESQDDSASTRSDSDSDSSESSNKPQGESSGSTSDSQSPQTSFSIRETNFEQGGLKLKLSATKPKLRPDQATSSSDSFSSSSEEDVKKDEDKKRPVRLQQFRRSLRPSSRPPVLEPEEHLSPPKLLPQQPIKEKSPPELSKMPVRRTRQSPIKRVPPKRQPVKRPLRPVRKSPRTKPKPGEAKPPVASSSESSSSDEENDEEDGDEAESGDEITQLAHQLDGGASGHDISISEHLQVINQEDLAAILPDVGGGGGSFDGFEDVAGEAPRPSTGSAAVQPPASIASSSSESDTEYQEQLVSEAISRIQVDSDTGKGAEGSQPQQGSPTTTQDEESDREETELLSRGGTSGTGEAMKGDEDSQEKPRGQGNIQPPRRRRGRPPKQNQSKVPQPCSSGMPELEAYMRLDCSQSNVSPDSGIQSVAGSPAGGHQSPPGSPRLLHNKAPPVLKPQSPQPQSASKAHCSDRLYSQRQKNDINLPSANDKITKLHSSERELRLENGGKRGPGRPKGSMFGLKRFGQKKRGSRFRRRSEIVKKPVVLPPSATELKVPPYFAGSLLPPEGVIPTLSGDNSKKRRGRPKKNPPVLEPILPLDVKSRDGSRKRNSNSVTLSRSTSRRKNCSRDNKCTKLALPKGLMRNKEHKHKKRKKQPKEFKILDPKFLSEMEKLAVLFQKSCFVGPVITKRHPDRLPPVFKMKKVLKKRKDRSRYHSPKESSEKIVSEISSRKSNEKLKNMTKERPKEKHRRRRSLKRDRGLKENREKQIDKTSRKVQHLEFSSPEPESIPELSEHELLSDEKYLLPPVLTKQKNIAENSQKEAKERQKVETSNKSEIIKEKETSSENQIDPKEKAQAPVLSKEKTDTKTVPVLVKDKNPPLLVNCNAPDQKEKCQPKDKTPQIQLKEKVPVLNNQKEKYSQIKEKGNVTPSSKDKLCPSVSVQKEKGATTPSNKEKIASTPTHKERAQSVSSPQQTQTNSKRRVKKSTIEIPKNRDKPEQPSNNNEQRLPLKKRHYHVSSTPSAINESMSADSEEKSDSSLDSSEIKQYSRTSVSPGSKSQSRHDNKKSEKQPEPDENAEKKEVVVVSPKKRHCIELEKKQGPVEKSKTKELLVKRMPPRNCNSSPQLPKRMSTRQAAVKEQEAVKPPSQVPKRSQRIQNESKEQTCESPRRTKNLEDESKKEEISKLEPEKVETAKPLLSSTRSKTQALMPISETQKSAKTKLEKPLLEIFDPSSHVEEEMRSLRSLENKTSDVVSKIKNKLLPNEEINLEDELKRLKRPMVEEEINEQVKKPKLICDLRVHVTKLSASDVVLHKMSTTGIKLKGKRKKINRTGFPAKKKKKKKLDLDVGDQTDPLSPPVLEDQTKLTVNTEHDSSTPSLSPILKYKEKPADSMDEDVKDETPESKVVTPKIQEEAKPKEDSEPELPQKEDKQKKEELAAKEEKPDHEEQTLEKPELRPASRRIMELKARTEVGEKCKRKPTITEDTPASSQDEDDKKKEPFEAKPTVKRARKCKDEAEDSDPESLLKKKNIPRLRKKYLPAGLFSDYYKEDEPRKSSGMTDDERKKTKTIVKNENENTVLPPPAYVAKWVKQRRLSFQLPYDLWWLHINHQLPGREDVPSWNYKKIRTNVYFDVKPSFSYEAQACNCKPNSNPGCGDSCINRMVLAECSPQLCPCKEKCSNQKIQRHEWAPGLVKFMTRDKGWGIKTKYMIQKDVFILEYVGEVVSDREFKSRMASKYQKDTHHYCLNLDSGLVIDGHRMGGEGRFVNHSCEPNCEMQKWCVNGLFRMALFALRDIKADEELTYDYNFSLFNPTEGQPCKCGSTRCRGVIGGKSQRMSIQGTLIPNVEPDKTTVGRVRKNLAVTKNRRKNKSVDKKQGKLKETKNSSKEMLAANTLATVAARLSHLSYVKPLTSQQKSLVLANKCFLIRNIEKVKRARERLKQAVKGGAIVLPEHLLPAASLDPGSIAPSQSTPSLTAPAKPESNSQEVFMTQMTALSCPRSMRTRRLAQAEDNPEMTKTAKLACIFKDLYNEVVNAKEESGELLSSHFITLPSKRKYPLYYQRIQNPIDLNMIEHNINTGIYKTVESFDQDMMNLFKNNVRWYGRTTDLGIAATRLRKIYNLSKIEILPKLEELLGTSPPSSFIPAQEDPGAEEEDVIRCICGLFRDEGLMIQCERCMVWQHAYCVRANPSVESYLCERCSPRHVDVEIPSQEESTTPGQTNYISLLRGDMHLKQGDTVYVLRDMINEESTTVPKSKHTYKTIKNWKFIDCDIFKIERLWKDEKGDRFAFGHHYLRPHETFHEPTRKFFPNELMRVPLYEVVPIELVMGQCYVLDLNTFCKGRPVGSDPEHIYICEYRVDKYARIFAKIPKPKHSNICTKSYAFEMFDTRLKPQRNYAPHGVPQEGNVSRGRGGRSAQHTEESKEKENASSASAQLTSLTLMNLQKKKQTTENPLELKEKKKTRLNKLLLRMLSKLPSKQPLDLSYLLEPGRRQRKKPPLLAS